MKDSPKGWPRISSVVMYKDANAAIDWLCRAFGFEVRIKVQGDNGDVVHSELTFGDGVIMPAQENAGATEAYRNLGRSSKSIGGVFTQSMVVQIDDADAHCARARAAGATIFMEPSVHDYGEDYWADKSYGAVDLEGHHWWFSQRVRDTKTPR